jgi:hypothetical protein
MVLLDWPPPDHLGIAENLGNSSQRKHPAEILALSPELRLPPSQLKRE